VLATLVGKLEARRQDCAPLAGKSTLNRLEHAPAAALDRYHGIGHDPRAIEQLFVGRFLEAHTRPPERIILDLDATDDPLHGHQEGRFFHGYYDCHCHLPLYVFCGRQLLAAKPRRSNIDAAAGATEEIARIVAQIRESWPAVEILLRADSGFARDELMGWCEDNGVDHVFGLARTPRLLAEIHEALAAAEAEHGATGQPARQFDDFTYATLDSWSRERRVVARAEHLAKGSNPRFVVTALPPSAIDGPSLCEQIDCARGEMENRIEEQQLDLFADRTSAATMRANQLRLWFAYVLLEAPRRIGLRHSQFADATCGTIRLKLSKIGAQVRISVRRIEIAMLAAPRRPPKSSLGQASGLPPPGRGPPRSPVREARRRLLSVQHTPTPRPHPAPAAARPKIRRWRRPRSRAAPAPLATPAPLRTLVSLTSLRTLALASHQLSSRNLAASRPYEAFED
jgi:hypothetical protein